MTVRLIKPYNGQTVNTLYTGPDEAVLKGSGNADDRVELATDWLAFKGAQVARTPNFPVAFSSSASAAGMPSATRSRYVQSNRRQNSPGQLLQNALTYRTAVTSEGPFTHIRLVFENPADIAVTVDKVAVAASAAAGDYFNAVDGAAAAVTPSPVYFNDFLADPAYASKPPPSFAGTKRDFVVPAALANPVLAPYGGTQENAAPNVVRGRAFSDWTPCASLARTDGGSKFIAIVGAFTAATGSKYMPLIGVGTTNANNYNAADDGRLWRTKYASGDQVDAGGTIGSLTAFGYGPAFTIEFFNNTLQSATVLGLGDSTEKGATSTGESLCAGWRACNALSSLSAPVSYVSDGVAGSSSAGIFARGRRSIDALRPDIVLIPVWTPNDAKDQTAANISTNAALDLARYAVSLGCIPVLVTPLPQNALDANADLQRLTARRRALASGFLVIDREVIGTGAAPNRIPASLTSDGTHPNDAGYAALDVNAYRPALAAAITALRTV